MDFSQFNGLQNVVSWERSSPGDLETAVDVYLDDSGRVARRDGLTEVVVGAAHSLWSHGNITLYAQGGSLKRLWDDNSSTTLRTDLSGDPVSYWMVADLVYYSDGTITGVYDQASDEYDWGVDEAPILSHTIIAGSLPPGRYGCVATFRDWRGREGGAVSFDIVELTATGGIAFTTPDMQGNQSMIVYVTPADGDVYYQLAEITSGGQAKYVDQDHLILPLNVAHKTQPPAGNIVSHYRGHMLVAAGPWIFYSEPYAYHLFGHNNFLPFADKVIIVAPVTDGIFVATSKEILFLGGEGPGKFVVTKKASYGAIEGTLLYTEAGNIGGFDRVPEQPVAMWSTPNGIVVAGDGGLFVNLTESRYQFDEVAVRGASVVSQMGGSNQFITTIL